MPITKNISEIKPTNSSFNIKITYPISMQDSPNFKNNFQESP